MHRSPLRKPTARLTAKLPSLLLVTAWSCLAAWLPRAMGQPYNASLDWVSDLAVRNISACGLPLRAPTTTAPSCPAVDPSRTLTPEETRLLGYLLAPKVYMHEKDWSYLADPEEWLLHTPIYDLQYRSYNFTDLAALYDANASQFLPMANRQYFASRTYAGNFWANATTQQVIDRGRGDPMDAQNRSTAKVWFSVTPAFVAGQAVTDALVFNYNLYYPFNGCSNQMLETSFNGSNQGIEFFMCAEVTSMHEGDWEHVSMYTCMADLLALLDNSALQADPVTAIRSIQYGQHGWTPEYNCSQPGSCPSEVVEGVNRIVVYAGLFSHASYPTASPLWVYQRVDIGFLPNADYLYISDRTSSKGPVFIPTRDNIRFMDLSNTSWTWFMYPGSWGGYYVRTHEFCVQCFGDRLNELGTCDSRNPAVYTLLRLLSITVREPLITDATQLTWRTNLPRNSTPPIEGLTGPLYRGWTYNWRRPSWPPASTQRNVTCPFTD